MSQPRAAQRILVIEDDDDVRAVIASTLSADNYYVAGLDNGAGALDSIRAQRPDLIILDLAMPGVDGVQVLAQLHAMEIRTPVLIASGMPDHQGRIEGVAAFLEKPFDLEELRRVVHALIGPSGGVAAPPSPPAVVPAIVEALQDEAPAIEAAVREIVRDEMTKQGEP